MESREVEGIVRSVLTHYGLGSKVGQVILIEGDWHVEVIDASGAKTTVIIATHTAQGVRRAVRDAFDVEG